MHNLSLEYNVVLYEYELPKGSVLVNTGKQLRI